MAAISNTDLQDIAVRCTSAFLNGGTPLSTSLAKEASDRGLNSEQVKRALEATNTLCYLKGLEVGSDRTSEFPLAEYGEVIKQASIPEGFTPPDCSVSTSAPQDDPFSAFLKQASVSEDALAWDGLIPQLDERATQAYLHKAAAANRSAIQNLEMESDSLVVGIQKAASDLRSYCRTYGQDLEFVLSASTLEDESLTKIATLLGVEDFRRQEFAQGLFTKSASNGVVAQAKISELDGLIKRAFVVQSELGERKAKDEMVKQAFLGQFLGRAAGAVLKAPFSVAGAAVKQVTRPIKALGQVGVNKLRDVAQNYAHANPHLADLKVPPAAPRQMSTKTKALVGTAGVIGTGAMDVAFATPPVSPITGESRDVWSQLHG